MNEKDRVEVQSLIEARSIPEPNSGCWLWTISCDQDGYGKMKWRGVNYGAHRLSFRAYHNQEPNGLSVTHSCDIPCCVNPAHLSLGTTLQNLRDAAAKGFMHRQHRRQGVSRDHRPIKDRKSLGRYDLTAMILRGLLSYDAETGAFTWLRRVDDLGWSTRFAGTVAGSTTSSHGYPAIRIGGTDYLAHRLVWLYSYGKWPERQIDHINGVRTDNRLSNLREASRHQNNQNVGLSKNNRSGVKGVSWDTKRGKWVAMITANGKQWSLGRFDEFKDAAAARRAAEFEHHGEFARTEGNA